MSFSEPDLRTLRKYPSVLLVAEQPSVFNLVRLGGFKSYARSSTLPWSEDWKPALRRLYSGVHEDKAAALAGSAAAAEELRPLLNELTTRLTFTERVLSGSTQRRHYGYQFEKLNHPACKSCQGTCVAREALGKRSMLASCPACGGSGVMLSFMSAMAGIYFK